MAFLALPRPQITSCVAIVYPQGFILGCHPAMRGMNVAPLRGAKKELFGTVTGHIGILPYSYTYSYTPISACPCPA